MSSLPTFHLSHCTPDDVPGMIEVYLAAFANDPVTSYIFPSTIPLSEMYRWLTARFTSQLAKRWIRMTKITVDSPTGLICAFLRYQIPHTLTPSEVSEKAAEEAHRASEKAQGRDPMWPVGANLPLVDEKFGAIFALQKKYVIDSEMYVAHLLATHPDWQRRGLGSMLLREMLEQADREGRRAYIEATDAGYPVYRKLGWRDLDVIKMDLARWGGEGVKQNRILIREPVVVGKETAES